MSGQASSPPFKVLLIANYPDLGQSMRRYADLVEGGLTAAGIPVRRIAPPLVFGRLWRDFSGPGKWLGYIDKYILFPVQLMRFAREIARDNTPWVVHITDHSNAVYQQWFQHTPTLATCHDLLAIKLAQGFYPGSEVSLSGRILQRWILKNIRQLNRVVCDSTATQRDVIALAGFSHEQAPVVLVALNRVLTPTPADEAWKLLAQSVGESIAKELANHGFIFHVSNNNWYKNRDGVVRLFARWREQFKHDTAHLVLAGAPLTPEMESLVDDAHLRNRVHLVKDCPDDVLDALYSLARVFVFPSRAEGFGWPVIEAQACGCPVTASRIEPLTEIGGNQVEYFTNIDEFSDGMAWADNAANALETIWSESSDARGARISAGLEHVKRFSRDAMMRELIPNYYAAQQTRAGR
ncbi:MAG: glycosyltransferase family 4 protein [Puniceicoccales bacterium]